MLVYQRVSIFFVLAPTTLSSRISRPNKATIKPREIYSIGKSMISMAMFNSYVKWPEGTHHLPTIIPSCSGRVGRRRTFFHPICLGQLLIFTHPMSGTSHHLSNSWESSASISIICFLRLNIHENPGVSDFRDFLQNFFRCFPMAAKKNHVNSMFSSQEGLEFPAHSHHQRPDLVAPRGLLLLPRHQEGGVGCESLGP